MMEQGGRMLRNTETAGLTDLPLDLQEELCCRYLQVRDIFSLARTCRALLKLLGRDSLWTRLCRRDFLVENGDQLLYRVMHCMHFEAWFDEPKPVNRGFAAVHGGVALRYCIDFGGCHFLYCRSFFTEAGPICAFQLYFDIETLPGSPVWLELEHCSSIVVHYLTPMVYMRILLNDSPVDTCFLITTTLQIDRFELPESSLVAGRNCVTVKYDPRSICLYMIRHAVITTRPGQRKAGRCQ